VVTGHSRQIRALTALAITGALVASGASAVVAQEPVKIAYLTKHLDNPWFVSETGGAEELAGKLNVDLTVQDLQFDANLALTAMDTVISAGTQGVIIVVPEQQIGPAVMEKAAAAGIPLIAVDDEIKDANGNPAPFVGFQASSVGEQVGNAAAALYKEKGWSPADTRIASTEVQTLSVCMDRTNAAIATFKAAVPDFPDENIIHIPVPTGTLVESTPVMTDVLTANPGVAHWILWACNDDGVLGSIRALEAAGMAADDAIGVGLGAHLACDEWAKETPTSFDAAVFLDAANHGKVALQLMYDNITYETPIPGRAIIPGPLVTEESHEALGCA
jgi:L-arabinose transport system substrate-binding protein